MPITVIERDVFHQTRAPLLHNPSTSHDIAIEVETDDEPDSAEVDSFYSSIGSSTTTSLTPSVFEYTYENGRRYASDRFQKASYFLPNDDSEQDRLDFCHHVWLLSIGGKLYIAPVEKPQRVLDLGTGTGIWAIDFATENEQAQVLGVDISPIQPMMIPPNCTFEVDDIEERWTWPKNYFDFIHMRGLSGSILDWELLIKQCYEHLQPGGLLEFQDSAGEQFFHTGKPAAGSGTPLANLIDLVIEASDKLGRSFLVAKKLKEMMEKAGFIDVHEEACCFPAGDWPKDKQLKHLGKWSKQGTLDSLEPFSLQLLTKVHKMSVHEVKRLCEAAREDLKVDSPNKYYFQGWFIWARKPYSSGQHKKSTGSK